MMSDMAAWRRFSEHFERSGIIALSDRNCRNCPCRKTPLEKPRCPMATRGWEERTSVNNFSCLSEAALANNFTCLSEAASVNNFSIELPLICVFTNIPHLNSFQQLLALGEAAEDAQRQCMLYGNALCCGTKLINLLIRYNNLLILF